MLSRLSLNEAIFFAAARPSGYFYFWISRRSYSVHTDGIGHWIYDGFPAYLLFHLVQLYLFRQSSGLILFIRR